MRISKQYSFDAAHQLYVPDLSDEENFSAFGKCARLHGHTYTLEVEVAGEVNPRTGMVMNYFNIDKVVKPIVDMLDHRNLNDHFDVLTTAENMVREIAHTIASALMIHFEGRWTALSKVTLSETPKTKATWEPAKPYHED